MIIMTVVLSYSVNISVCACMSKHHNASGNNKSMHFLVSSFYIFNVLCIYILYMYKITFCIE